MQLASCNIDLLCSKETVQQGIFSDMRFAYESSFAQIRPLLLGTYEKELSPYIQQTLSKCDGSIVVGAAEGYYAVGLARKAPRTNVIAFEIDEDGRRILLNNAKKKYGGTACANLLKMRCRILKQIDTTL
jgi:tRNA G46 methylase TrmB